MSTNRQILIIGSRGQAVFELQRKLAQLGAYRGKLDGIFGPKTCDAVKAFQKSCALVESGVADGETQQLLWPELYEALRWRVPEWLTPHIAGGVWGGAQLLPGMDHYEGLKYGSARILQSASGNALLWESKFDICADGDNSRPEEGDTFVADTALHNEYDKPLNPWTWPYAVLPLRREHAPLDAFGAGMRLGDVGMAFYKDRKSHFIVGDRGPASKIGEGSILLAQALGIDASPTHGGIHPKDGQDGVVFLTFIGSARKHGMRTLMSLDEVVMTAFDRMIALNDPRNWNQSEREDS